jgi:hypothetical protein
VDPTSLGLPSAGVDPGDAILYEIICRFRRRHARDAIHGSCDGLIKELYFGQEWTDDVTDAAADNSVPGA